MRETAETEDRYHLMAEWLGCTIRIPPRRANWPRSREALTVDIDRLRRSWIPWKVYIEHHRTARGVIEGREQLVTAVDIERLF